MERVLTSYIRALRSAGAQVSTAETLDAMNALALVGYADRDRMRETLGIVLAKSEDDKTLHERLFDQFFARAEADTEASGEGEDAAAEPKQAGGQGAPEGGAPGGEAESAFFQLARSGDDARIALALEQAAAASGADQIRFRTQTAFFTRRMLEEMGVRELEERMVERLQNGSPEAQAEADELAAARAAMQSRAREYVDRLFDVFGRSATEAFLDDVVVNRPIGELSLRDMERMKAVVARMAKRLAIRHSHRRRKRRRGHLDIRRTMRANVRYDGTPFDLIWKEKRRDKPQIVAVCDVSGSVAQYVRFLLLLLYALQEGIADLRAFAFSARLMDVGPILKSRDFDSAMKMIVRDAGGGSTDYGQALCDLEALEPELIDRRTTVLVLGDGRTNRTDPRLDLFSAISERAKRVVWLCPEPPGMWGSGDSRIPSYRPFCTVLSYCATASDIERAVDEALAAYG
jgi:hypothetical protein